MVILQHITESQLARVAAVVLKLESILLEINFVVHFYLLAGSLSLPLSTCANVFKSTPSKNLVI